MRPLRTNKVFFVFAVAGTVATGCGDKPADPVPQPPPVVSAPPPASAAMSASAMPTASATTSASADLSALPIPSVVPPQGPVKWADFGGPEVKSPVKDGQRAWAALPVSAGWDTLKLTLHDVARVEETQVVFTIDGTDYFVPAAFVIAAEPPKDLAVGEPVMASAYGTRVFGRVTALGPKMKVKYRFATSIEEKEFDPADLIKLDGALRFGAPVLIKEEKEGVTAKEVKLRPGQFISSDANQTWILAFAGKPIRVPSASVQSMDIRQHKVQDKVWVTRQDEVVRGLVEEVLDDGVRYKIKLESGDESTATLDAVTVPLSGAPGPSPSGSASAGPPPH